MKNLVFAFGVVILTLISISVSFGQKTLLFKITGNGLTKPSYVFGTMHLTCTENYKLPLRVTKAVKESAIIFTEVEIGSIQTKANTVLQIMMAAPDSTLDKVLSESDYKKVGSFLNDTLGMFAPLEGLKTVKPNAILTGIQKFAGCNPFSFVEELLIAVNPNKKNIGFETIPFQMQMLMSPPITNQSKNLIETIDNWIIVKAELKQIMDAYVAGNLDSLNKLMTQFHNFDILNQGFLSDSRRENWVKKMPALMKKQSVFFAVGAGHLPGKMGVLALLKAKGYKVTPVALN